MKCPNCGAEMKEGSLYCEHCGEDIHIVPDFEPEIEYNLEQTLNHIVEDMVGPNSQAPAKVPSDVSEFPEETAEASEEVSQDWDRQEGKDKKPSKRYLFGCFLGILLVIGIVGAAFGIAGYRYNSVDYQIDRAVYYATEGDYDKSVSYYSRALEIEPARIDLKFSLAEVYFLKNNKIEYEYLLRDIIKDKNATVEQLESAYGKLIAIYRARDDYKTINELLQASTNESIKSIYQSYIAMDPEFSVKEGYYTTIQPLKLTTYGTGKIYYSMDGSDPDEDSALYTAPILLEKGDYCIKAVYVNENGIFSNIVKKNYHIEIEMLPSPEINIVSGDYQIPLTIEVDGDDEFIYYTTDGSTPTESSAVYTGPIPMPLGQSVYNFIKIEDGRSSEVVERVYYLELDTDISTVQAENMVVEYSISTGKIYDAEGYFDDTGAMYKYLFQYASNINDVSDFYVIAEFLQDAAGNSARTGNYFAVDVYTQKMYKIQTDENNNYILVEIEKEAYEE